VGLGLESELALELGLPFKARAGVRARVRVTARARARARVRIGLAPWLFLRDSISASDDNGRMSCINHKNMMVPCIYAVRRVYRHTTYLYAWYHMLHSMYATLYAAYRGLHV
jgi:hypothetical protein